MGVNSPWDYYVAQREKARKSINSAWDAKLFLETYGGNNQSNNSNRNAGKNAYSYNYDTRNWDKLSSSTPTVTQAQTSYSSSSMSNNGALSQTGVSNTGSSANTSSRTNAEKEYIEVEFNTLTGECSVVPTAAAMKLKVSDTIKITGIGKFLSGQFFIAGINRTIDSSGGYSMS